jgi:hypothetical protein
MFYLYIYRIYYIYDIQIYILCMHTIYIQYIFYGRVYSSVGRKHTTEKHTTFKNIPLFFFNIPLWVHSSIRRKNSIIPLQDYSSVVKEITYIPIIRKGELIFNLLFPQAKASSRRNLDKKMKNNDDTDDYILR